LCTLNPLQPSAAARAPCKPLPAKPLPAKPVRPPALKTKPAASETSRGSLEDPPVKEPDEGRHKKQKVEKSALSAGTEGKLGGLLLQLQRQREDRERDEAARRSCGTEVAYTDRDGASDEDARHEAAGRASMDGSVEGGGRQGRSDSGGEHSDKLRVLESIVEACPRGSVFEFHEYLMRMKDEEHGDFICLCAALLSVQCLDHVAMKACEKLRLELPGGLSVSAVADQTPETLEPLINTCNYYKGKAKKIHSCACALLRRHKGRVPRTQAALLELEGVGPKIANLVLSVGLG